MAIDTAERRKSVSGIPLLIPGVTPNISKDVEWRQESGWNYPGITVSTPPVIKFTDIRYFKQTHTAVRYFCRTRTAIRYFKQKHTADHYFCQAHTARRYIKQKYTETLNL